MNAKEYEKLKKLTEIQQQLEDMKRLEKETGYEIEAYEYHSRFAEQEKLVKQLKGIIENEETPEEKTQRKILKKKSCKLGFAFIPAAAAILSPAAVCVGAGAIIGAITGKIETSMTMSILPAVFSTLGLLTTGTLNSEKDTKLAKFLSCTIKPLYKNIEKLIDVEDDIEALDNIILNRVAEKAKNEETLSK